MTTQSENLVEVGLLEKLDDADNKIAEVVDALAATDTPQAAIMRLAEAQSKLAGALTWLER